MVKRGEEGMVQTVASDGKTAAVQRGRSKSRARRENGEGVKCERVSPLGHSWAL
jgi:hypothetical protein